MLHLYYQMLEKSEKLTLINQIDIRCGCRSLKGDATCENNSSTADHEINVISVTNELINFLVSLGHAINIISQSPRLSTYQVSLFDLIPRSEINAVWIPADGIEGVMAEIQITVFGEWIKLQVKLREYLCPLENGRYQLEVRSFEEFFQWYNSTFGEGAL